MKRYVAGYYSASSEHLEILSKESNRSILRALRAAYPKGLDASQIQEKTELSKPAIHAQVKELEKSGFIEVKISDKNSNGVNKRGRPKATNEQQRKGTIYVIEECSAIFETDDYSPILAPGYTDYNPGFTQVWHKVVNKQEENELYSGLTAFMDRVLRRTSESNDKEVRKWAPQLNDEQFFCSQCRFNHEARDFVRAVLLHLLDHFEESDSFVDLMKNRLIITPDLHKELKAPEQSEQEEGEDNETNPEDDDF